MQLDQIHAKNKYWLSTQQFTAETQIFIIDTSTTVKAQN